MTQLFVQHVECGTGCFILLFWAIRVASFIWSLWVVGFFNQHNYIVFVSFTLLCPFFFVLSLFVAMSLIQLEKVWLAVALVVSSCSQ